MSESFKDLAELKHLGKALKKQKEAQEAAERERARQQRETQREADIFRRAVGDVTPLAQQNRVDVAVSPPSPIPHQRHADEREVLRAAMSDEFDVTTLLEVDETLSYRRDGIGPDVVRKLRKGHWVIQDEFDLHGMRRDEARDALADFLREVTKRGLRCVRIIHGKGLGSVNKEPVLKKMVHKWLVQKDEVIAFCQAKAADGGSGALVVLLKGRG
ncbi:MAG: mismatch repair protein MutS [Burkholderiaceae bacterium]|nr:mismatch repair protein MutS [Burkholderiaceae bacterium]